MKCNLKILFAFILTIFFSNTIAQTLKLDTLKRNDSITISQVKLTSASLKIDKEIASPFVMFKIYHNRIGYIKKEYEKITPKKDEIIFFYGQNYKAKKFEMFFKIGKSLQLIYSENNFNQQIEIVKVLEYQIFGIDSFSGTSAFGALREVKYK